MIDKIKSIFNSQKGGVTLGFTQVLGACISGVFAIFIAPVLGAKDFGTVSYFSAIAGMAFPIVSFGISNILLVYLSKGVKIFSTISLITLVSSLIAAITVFILFHEISIGILIIGQVIFELTVNELLAKQLYSKHMKYFLTQRLSFVVLSVSLYFIWGPSGFILGQGISMFPGLLRIYRGFKESRIDLTLIKNKFNFILPNYFLNLTRVTYIYVDRVFIFPIFGSIPLGNYELSMQIIIMANVFSVFLYLYVIPKDARNQATHKIKFYSIIISFIISLMVIFLAPMILPMIFPQFKEAIDLIRIMGISIMPHTLIMLNMSRLIGSERTKPVLISSLLHLGVLIVAILVLIKFYSITGVVMAFVLGEIVEAIFLMIVHKSIFKTYL